MKSELESALVELITKSIDSVKMAGDFLKEEIPEVVSQLLMWHGIHSFIYFVLFIFIAVGLFYGSYRCFKFCMKRYKEDKEKKEDDAGVYIFFAIVPWVASILFFVLNVSLEWLQIWIAPKVWLLEYASNLIK